MWISQWRYGLNLYKIKKERSNDYSLSVHIMLKRIPFANALASLSGAFYIVFAGLQAIAPDFFVLIYNAQFFGADVARLFSRELTMASFIGTLVILVITGWVAGYVLACSYNWFSKR